MSEPLPFPIDIYVAELLRAQQKRATLVQKRDRLNVRIAYLDDYIDKYWERHQRQKEFWERLRQAKLCRDPDQPT